MLVRPPPGEGFVVFSAWDADASRVYYATFRPSGLRWSYWAMPVTGGPPRRLLTFDARGTSTGGVSFVTDGQWLYLTLAADDADVRTLEPRAGR